MRWTALSKAAGSGSEPRPLSGLSATAAADAQEPSLAARDAAAWRRRRRCATAAWRCRPRPAASAADLCAQHLLLELSEECNPAARESCLVRLTWCPCPCAVLLPLLLFGLANLLRRSMHRRLRSRTTAPCSCRPCCRGRCRGRARPQRHGQLILRNKRIVKRLLPTDTSGKQDRCATNTSSRECYECPQTCLQPRWMNMPALTMRSRWSFRCRLRASSLFFVSCILATSLWR